LKTKKRESEGKDFSNIEAGGGVFPPYFKIQFVVFYITVVWWEFNLSSLRHAWSCRPFMRGICLPCQFLCTVSSRLLHFSAVV